MRNVSIRCCSNNNNNNKIKRGIATVKGPDNGMPFSDILMEVRRRLRYQKGLSATRKELLLRECHYFAAMEQARGKGGSFSHSRLVSSPTGIQHITRWDSSHGGRKKNSLRHVLQRMAEFIASTGECGDHLVPLQGGYDQLTPAKGLLRSELVLRYTEAALSISNERMASIVTLAFGRCPHDDETITSLGTDAPPLDSGSKNMPMNGEEEKEEEEASFSLTRDDDGDAAAPFTSLEAVALLRWCAWHMRTALNGLQDNGPQLMECIQPAVTLMSRFLRFIVDMGLQGGAVDSAMDELELSDMGYAVADQVLSLLYSCAPLRARGCFPSFSFLPSPSVGSFHEDNDGSGTNGPCLGEAAWAGGDDDTCDRHDRDHHGKSTAVDDRWRSLRISEDAQQALLCSQRERWERALKLLLRTQRWNEWVDASADTPPPAEKNKEENETLAAEELRTLLALPMSVLQTLKYVLAQHGQWGLCKALWKETVRKRFQGTSSLSTSADSSPSPFAALHHPFNVDNIITALAFVNARPSLSSAAAGEGTKDAPDLSARLLRLLLHLGVVPNRALSAAEFAALLRQSFGLPLGCGPVEGILSPSFVWRRTAAHPHRVRATLCILCFQLVVKCGLTHTLEVEDLYVVTSILRQFLQGQFRRGVSRAPAAASVLGEGGDDDEDDIRHRIGENLAEKDEEWALGLLPVTFAAATRRTKMIAAEAHIVAITEVFLARRREILPVREEEAEGGAKRTGTNMDPQLGSVHTTATTVVAAAAAAAADNDSKKKRINKRKSRSAVILSLLSREIMALMAMVPYGNAVGRTWQAALGAISTEVERDALDHCSARAVEGLASAMAKKVLEPGGTHLLEPLLRLAPYLSPFTVSKIVQGPVGSRLTWEQSLRLLPCTPWASNIQRRLLRRVVQERDASELPNLQGLMQAITLPPRLLHAYPTLITDMRMLKILAERNWSRALEAYTSSDSRVQWACAPHVMRLAILANVWYSPHGSGCEALRSVLWVAVRANGGERVAEEVLHASLSRGMWATGLAFHQLLQAEQPEMLRKNRRIEAYGALLCKGLLSQSALTRTIAEVLKWARGAKWAEASEAFIRYAEEGNLSSGQILRESREMTVDGAPPPHWAALFPASVPSQLSHIAHTVRYSMLCTPGRWEHALTWFPSHTLPLPLHHRLQLHLLTGAAADFSEYESVEKANEGAVEDGAHGKAETASRLLPSPLSMSLVQIALQEKLHRTRRPTDEASAASVEQTLRVLQKRGQWEQAMVVCEHALANRRFPHSSSSILLAACTSSWEVSLSCFAHLTGRMRPDAVTAALALKACVTGHQWVLALRILRQSVLTSATPPPRVVTYAVRAALVSGAWQAALRVVRQYQGTTSPLLANTVMQAYVQSECWNDAVEYFYECVKRGICPLDESLAMAITASQAVSAEYRDAARVVGAIASALEDFCHVHGVVLEHVLVVYREMSPGPIICSDPDVSLVSLARTQRFSCHEYCRGL
ncbi:hypothetical protein MOQ_005367 [Trypanosoma cruzi marinkellei]|uniref:Uncharacterized protein n=1 Tax=Trypanosoma cruzi marinkellei TaxID=85056 RepID=K2MUP7_TRYCR|nr:hypothetical protein MOQ_005367 [Trypanosoma cruzi marinkellei]